MEHKRKHPLTAKEIKAAKPENKPYKLSDGGGLYLLVQPDGAKYWRLKYYFLGKEKLLALGVYPTVTLADARERRDNAKRLISNGQDPASAKKEEKRNAIRKSNNTFESVAREWHEKQIDKWSEHHSLNVMRRLEIDILPYIGLRPISEIDPPELLDDVLRRIEKRNSLDIAARAKQICGQVFRYGIATGKCTRDPSADLKGALKVGKTKHFPAIDIKELPEFLNILEINEARLFARTRRAIRMLMLCFTRTTELIHATWDEFDFENNVWEIPAERMKMAKPHIVPLSNQVVEILREQQEETGHLKTNWVFPSQIRPQSPMSNNTILFAIGRIGYKGRMTGHGFRALAMSTIKERLGYRHEVVDRQLAHAQKNKIDRAYDRAQFLDERTVMMQEWANYIDTICSKNNAGQSKFKTAKTR